MSVSKSSAPWVPLLAFLDVTRAPSTLWPLVAPLLVLPRLHPGLGQRIPAAYLHRMLHWPLWFHIEIEKIVRMNHERKKKYCSEHFSPSPYHPLNLFQKQLKPKRPNPSQYLCCSRVCPIGSPLGVNHSVMGHPFFLCPRRGQQPGDVSVQLAPSLSFKDNCG